MKYHWEMGGPLPLLDEHSETKHNVLRSYLARYIEVVTGKPQREYLNITLVDGFCGGGLYTSKQSANEVPGSPLIFLEEVHAAQARFDIERRKRLKINADYIFIDQEKSAFRHLEHVLEQRGHNHKIDEGIKLINADFNDVVDRLIKFIKNKDRSQRAIFLLDQYGYNQVSFRSIREIFASLAHPEVLLTFNVDSLIRYLSDDPSVLSAVAKIDLSRNNVQTILSLKEGVGWRYLIQNALYEHVVKETGAQYYTCFFIKSPMSHESYWFLHLSQHHRARDEMALRHWALSNHFIHHGGDGLWMLGFDPHIDTNQIPLDFIFGDSDENRVLASLRRDLPKTVHTIYGKGSGKPTFELLFSSVCNSTPATSHIMMKALVDLRADKQIEITSADGRERPRAHSFQWDDIVLPAKQTAFGFFRRR